jgi:hypothetical protein
MSVSAASAVGEVAMSEPHPASVPVLEPPSVVIWLVGFAAIVLIFSGESHSFYDPEPARR